MDSWKKFYGTLLPDKEDLYSDLKMEDNPYADYMHAKRVRIIFCTFKMTHYYLQMYLKALETNVLRYMNSILFIFISTWISMASVLQKAEIELELLTDIVMLLMVQKGIRVGMSYNT